MFSKNGPYNLRTLWNALFKMLVGAPLGVRHYIIDLSYCPSRFYTLYMYDIHGGSLIAISQKQLNTRI